MRAGQLRSAIVIDRRTETIDAAGTPRDAWTPVLRTRAHVISRDARTFIAEAGEEAETAIVFRIRYRDGIEAGDRVTFGDREFALVELKEVVRRRVLELRCTGGGS